jgi:hypothetical protein
MVMLLDGCLCTEGWLNSSLVKSLEKEESRGEVGVFLWERVDEGHDMKFIITMGKGEVGGSKGLDSGHSALNSSHQGLQRFILPLPDVEEFRIGIESRWRMLVEVHWFQLCPDGSRIIFNPF